MRIVFYCPTEIKEIKEIFIPLCAAISAISDISSTSEAAKPMTVGHLLYHATGFSTKEYFCPTERTEIMEIFVPTRGAFLLLLSFLRDYYYLMRKVFYCPDFYCPAEIKEIAEIIVTDPREVLSALSAISSTSEAAKPMTVGHYYLMHIVLLLSRSRLQKNSGERR